uniref:Oxysterol-binding protein n=1 Tax=Neogobius melanostomus TaxID=47308 RepID=A0A8C6WZW8_9GOBI
LQSAEVRGKDPAYLFEPSHALSCLFKTWSKNSRDSWEIVEGLRGAPATIQEPYGHHGFLLKRRKWPLKGWHKRYFVLEKGIMKYGKREGDIKKGKVHGCIDVGLSVMSIKKKSMCIDLDTEDNLYHLKVTAEEGCTIYVNTVREAENYLQELNLLLKSMEVMHRTCSAPAITTLQNAPAYDLPKKDKRPRRWRSKNNGKEGKSTLQVPCMSSASPRLHASNPNLSTSDPPFQESSPDFHDNCGQVCHFFVSVVYSNLKSAYTSLSSERNRIRHSIDLQAPPPAQVMGLKTTYGTVSHAQNTPQTLNHGLTENIYISILYLLKSVKTPIQTMFLRCSTVMQECPAGSHSLVHQTSNDSRASIPESITEFFDAQEYLLSSSSSENEVSDDDSYISDVSDTISMDTCDGATHRHYSGQLSSEARMVRRRSTLPAPCSSSSVSLWNILRNNIGKDLSKVAMPVELNEPLNTLQRLTEELEYSELLDLANQTADPYQRMVYVASFAISAYACTYSRAGSKPFNPVLGETYECDRPDKGFRFIAEQVSHHPPVSACHADSTNFTFWQDVRWKNKFWGRTMEIVPMGTTHVTLPEFGDHYEWNKVTSCIHNILSGQRWIEHYGEMSIRNSNSSECQCKVTFVKVRALPLSTVNEVEAVITDSDGTVVHSLFGKWNEALFQGAPPSATCLWRANSLPENHEQYYGFTQFAVELNELDPALRALLPPTDTRFRPDQRLLEEGDIGGAEEQKQRLEQLQRDRRRVKQDNNMKHQPRFFKKSRNDTWISNNTYWEQRREPGFRKIEFPILW